MERERLFLSAVYLQKPQTQSNHGRKIRQLQAEEQSTEHLASVDLLFLLLCLSTWPQQCKEEFILGSWFEGTTFHHGRRQGDESIGQLVTLHSQVVEKWMLVLVCFLYNLGPQIIRSYHPHTLCESSLSHPERCLLGDSKSSLVDSETEHHSQYPSKLLKVYCGMLSFRHSMAASLMNSPAQDQGSERSSLGWGRARPTPSW